MVRSLLGGLSTRAFLHRYWQKRPLVVRGAMPHFRGVIGKRALLACAARHDVEARLVERVRGRWRVTHAPIERARLAGLPRRDWTLLVSGVNLHCAAADRLLRRFAFLPYARLDDVMVSYAAPGGGVGPHFDAYDVFLLQSGAPRVWRLERARRFRVRADAPLRLIEDFSPDEELLLDPGDLLYVPPGWGHEGIALRESFTTSIGFRAPAGAELGAAFLDWLHERGLPEAAYRDPRLAPAVRPARLPRAMVRFARDALARIRWSTRDVADFLGEFLSRPKPHVVFRAPGRPLPPDRFPARLRRTIAALDPKTQLLYDGSRFFLNGERFVPPRGARSVLAGLADRRCAAGAVLARARLTTLAYEWYRSGVLRLEAPR
jgi:50S ribosomal protein L16 3-hydroxylase